jgi:hypothetical protein
MFSITINDKKYKCISNPSEISLHKTRILYSILKKENQDLEIKLEAIAMISDIPVDLLLHFKEENADKILNNLIHHIIEVPKALKIKKNVYVLLDFDNLTIAQYGEIEYLFLNYKNEYDIIHKLIDILLKRVINYRYDILYYIKNRIIFKNIMPVKLKRFEWTLDNKDNSEFFDNSLDGMLGMNIFNAFIEWRKNLIKEYPDLYPTIEKEEEISYNVLDKWGIYHILNSICSSLSERDEWSKKNIRELFKYLTYLKIKNKEEKRLI